MEDRTTKAVPVPDNEIINQGFGKKKPMDGVEGSPVVGNDSKAQPTVIKPPMTGTVG